MRASWRRDGLTVDVVGEESDGEWSGWSFVVAQGEAGPAAVAVVAPAGSAITADTWRALPIGQVLARGRHLFREPALVQALGRLAEEGIVPGKRKRNAIEHERVARIYRVALECGASGPEVVGAVYLIGAKRASNDLITPARQAGYLYSATEEERLHRGKTGHWLIDGRVVNRPPTLEDFAALVARAIQQQTTTTPQEEQ